MNATKKKAVVLLSGGVDSSTCLSVAKSEGYECYALSVHYGQRNMRELESARRVASALGAVRHEILELDLRWIGGSALTADMAVPKHSDGGAPPDGQGVPITYVPARNSVFLTVAAGWAEALGTDHVFIGVNQLDYSGYPDCRPAFIAAMQHALRLGTQRAELCIHTPLINLRKREIIELGTSLGLDYGITWSCYDPQHGKACGQCDACLHRRNGFVAAGVNDPTDYFVPDP